MFILLTVTILYKPLSEGEPSWLKEYRDDQRSIEEASKESELTTDRECWREPRSKKKPVVLRKGLRQLLEQVLLYRRSVA